MFHGFVMIGFGAFAVLSTEKRGSFREPLYFFTPPFFRVLRSRPFCSGCPARQAIFSLRRRF